MPHGGCAYRRIYSIFFWVFMFTGHCLVALAACWFFVLPKQLNNLHVLKPINKFNCTIECFFFYFLFVAATRFLPLQLNLILFFFVSAIFICIFFVRIFPLQNV